jgi:hypothetical protein
MRNVSVLFTAAAVVILSAPGLFAQAQGFGGSMMGGGGGGMGGGGMGGGMSGGSGMGTGMGGGMGSSSTGGLSMLNASSLSGGFGVLGFGSMNGFGSSSTGGSSMYGGRAYGAVTQAGGGTGMSGAGGGRTTSSSGSTTSSGGGGGAASSTNRKRGTSNTNTAAKEQQAWFEPRIEIGFEVPTPQVTAIASSVANSLAAGKPGRFRSVQVAFEGGTAILRGVVATPNDRILAEQIALLEPSVSGVRNDLTVAGRAGSSTAR